MRVFTRVVPAFAIVAMASPLTASPAQPIFDDARVRIEWTAGWDDGHWAGSFEVTGAHGDLFAEASYEFCEFDECEWRVFPPQEVAGSGFDLDPIGNAASINVCLEVDSGGECEPFVFALSRPSTMHLMPCCEPSPWIDHNSGQVGVNARTGVSVVRAGYFVDADGSRRGFNSNAAAVTSWTERFVGLDETIVAP